jgi:hypothetical protein
MNRACCYWMLRLANHKLINSLNRPLQAKLEELMIDMTFFSGSDHQLL